MIVHVRSCYITGKGDTTVRARSLEVAWVWQKGEPSLIINKTENRNHYWQATVFFVQGARLPETAGLGTCLAQAAWEVSNHVQGNEHGNPKSHQVCCLLNILQRSRQRTVTNDNYDPLYYWTSTYDPLYYWQMTFFETSLVSVS